MTGHNPKNEVDLLPVFSPSGTGIFRVIEVLPIFGPARAGIFRG